MSDVPLIGEMSITDEHVLLPLKTRMKRILRVIRDDLGTAVILHERKQRIVGVITAIEIEEAVRTGVNRKKLKATDVMSRNILELPSDLPLDQALEEIEHKRPDAVVIRDADGDFAGFFSIADYHEAQDLLADQQAAVEQFAERTSELEQAMQELHDEIEDEPAAPSPIEEEHQSSPPPSLPIEAERGVESAPRQTRRIPVRRAPSFDSTAVSAETEAEDDSHIPAEMRHLPLSPHILWTLKATAAARKAKEEASKKRTTAPARAAVPTPAPPTPPTPPAPAAPITPASPPSGGPDFSEQPSSPPETPAPPIDPPAGDD